MVQQKGHFRLQPERSSLSSPERGGTARMHVKPTGHALLQLLGRHGSFAKLENISWIPELYGCLLAVLVSNNPRFEHILLTSAASKVTLVSVFVTVAKGGPFPRAEAPLRGQSKSLYILQLLSVVCVLPHVCASFKPLFHVPFVGLRTTSVWNHTRAMFSHCITHLIVGTDFLKRPMCYRFVSPRRDATRLTITHNVQCNPGFSKESQTNATHFKQPQTPSHQTLIWKGIDWSVLC